MVLQYEREARIKAEAKHDAVRLSAQRESQAALRAQDHWISEREVSPCYMLRAHCNTQYDAQIQSVLLFSDGRLLCNDLLCLSPIQPPGWSPEVQPMLFDNMLNACCPPSHCQ